MPTASRKHAAAPPTDSPVVGDLLDDATALVALIECAGGSSDQPSLGQLESDLQSGYLRSMLEIALRLQDKLHDWDPHEDDTQPR